MSRGGTRVDPQVRGAPASIKQATRLDLKTAKVVSLVRRRQPDAGPTSDAPIGRRANVTQLPSGVESPEIVLSGAELTDVELPDTGLTDAGLTDAEPLEVVAALAESGFV